MKTTMNLCRLGMGIFLFVFIYQNGNCQQTDIVKSYNEVKLKISQEIASNPDLMNNRDLAREFMKSRMKELSATSAFNASLLDIYWADQQRIEPSNYASNSTVTVDEGDLAALTDLYNQCNGANWINNENWLTGDPSTWYGVLISDEGRVMGLFLGGNNLTGELPESFTNLSGLENIQLYNNSLEGDLPESWSVWTGLKYLILSGNEFTGNLPDSWSSWASIMLIDLKQNQIDGPLPDSWSAMSNLRDLMLGSNQISGSIPANWGNLSQSRFFVLSWCNLGGPLPVEWANLTNLEFLDMSGNQFEGSLPSSWSSLTNLQYLGLGFNQITGDLPTTWESLVELQTIDLGSNQIEGGLPANWSILNKLNYVYIGNNNLYGELPSEWGSLDIRGFDITGNGFTGEIPTSWSDFPNLESFECGYNNLSGSIPDLWPENPILHWLQLSNNNFTGLPDFSGSNINVFYVNWNLLDFADLIPNAGKLINSWQYAPQKPFGEVETVAINQGQFFSRIFVIEGEGNIYQWYKDDQIIDGATTDELFIDDVKMIHQGQYTLRVTNLALPELTLESNPITLEVIIPDAIITQFGFSYSDCGCHLGTQINRNNSEIVIVIPYTLDISNLAPTLIEIPEGASVSPPVGVAQDWTNGTIIYTVTEAEGGGTWDWAVRVLPFPCAEKQIFGLTFPENPVGAVLIDQELSIINITIQEGSDLSSVTGYFDLPCGAGIGIPGQSLSTTYEFDFSTGSIQGFNVVAQDGSMQVWTIILTEKNLPIVTFAGGEAQNCSTGITFSGNKNGWLAIVHEEAIENGQPIYDLATDDGRNQLQWNQLGNWAQYFVAWGTSEVSLNNIRPGTYYAFAMDQLGNTSVMSEETLLLSPCPVFIQSLTELRNNPLIYEFNIACEIIVSYEETPLGGDQFIFAQDQEAGIKIVDRNGILPGSYGIGAGLTGMIGFLEQTGNELIFIPTVAPTQSTAGNIINPVELTYNEYYDQCYSGNQYESMLVRITTPMKAFDDYGLGYTTWELDNLDLATTTASGNYDWFIQKTFNADYIGTEIPTGPTIYQGIRTNVNWGSMYGLITPRSLSDLAPVNVAKLGTNGMVYIDAVPLNQCQEVSVDIYNEGVGELIITGAEFSAESSGELYLCDQNTFSITIPQWESATILIGFCPQDPGDEPGKLLMHLSGMQDEEISVMGRPEITHLVPFYEDFNQGAPFGWYVENMRFGPIGYNLIADGSGYYYGWSWVEPRSALPAILRTPPIDLSGMVNPILSFYVGTYFSSNLKVEVSPDRENWTMLQDYANWTLGDGVGENIQLDLSPWLNETVYIRWHGYDQVNYFGLDNIGVSEEILSFEQETIGIQGTAPGKCKSGSFNLLNSGLLNSTISSIQLDPFSSTNFSITNLPELPLQLSPGENLEIYIDFCPVSEEFKNTSLLISYGNGKLVTGYISAYLTPINGMNVVETFNGAPVGENVPGGWEGTLQWNLSIHVGNVPAWLSSPDSSNVMFMRNRMAVDGARAATSIISPRIFVDGENPVVTWQEISYTEFNYSGTNSSPRSLYVSTDGVDFVWVDTYYTNEMPDAFVGDHWRTQTYSLDTYRNQTIWWKWEMESNNDEYIYWAIDNVCFQQKPGPEISIGDLQDIFNISLTNTSKPRDLRIFNASSGFLQVQNIEFLGSGAFHIAEPLQFPISIAGYDQNNPQTVEEFAIPIMLAPPSAGNFNETMRVTYGPNGEYQEDVALGGVGFECSNIQEASLGENWAASQNTIFRYTAEYDEYVTVSSCHPANTTDPYVYSYDTYLEFYTECGGNFISGIDDDEWEICPYNRASSTLSTTLNAGESILIFWPKYFNSVNDQEVFVFTVDNLNTQVTADFDFSRQLLQPEGSVDFYDQSSGIITSWLWTFEGGVPNTSTEQNPVNIVYPGAGRYPVTLAVSNEYSQHEITKEFAITVEDYNDPPTAVWSYDFSTGGMKNNGGWTFVDLTRRGFDWVVRDNTIGGNHTNQPPLGSTTWETGFLVLPADEYNSPAPNINSYFVVDAFAQSPYFDCSDLDLVVFKFEQSFRHCCDENAQMLVMVSNNHGATWDSYDIKNGREAGEVHGDPVEWVKLDISKTAQKQPEVMIRFYWQGSVRDFWMIDDVEVYGYSNCQELEIEEPDSYAVYFGYLPAETVEIFAPKVLTGKAPFTYLWSTGETTPSIKVNPKESTTFLLTIFDATGCDVQCEIFVNFVDVRCGKKNDKVLICVNAKNPHSICVSPNAVPAQLSNGATLGDCGDGKPVGFGYDEFDIEVYPNPNAGTFTIQGTLTSTDRSLLQIKNVLGQTVYFEELNLPEGSFIHEITIPDATPGMYFLLIHNNKEFIRQTIVIE